MTARKTTPKQVKVEAVRKLTDMQGNEVMPGQTAFFPTEQAKKLQNTGAAKVCI